MYRRPTATQQQYKENWVVEKVVGIRDQRKDAENDEKPHDGTSEKCCLSVAVMPGGKIIFYKG